MGGHQVPGTGTGDDGYDEDGYDESQRAEILEATRDGRSDGTVLTDLNPDLGGEVDSDDEEDEILMVADEQSEEALAETDADDDDEDERQQEFDDGMTDADDLPDGDATALNP